LSDDEKQMVEKNLVIRKENALFCSQDSCRRALLHIVRIMIEDMWPVERRAWPVFVVDLWGDTEITPRARLSGIEFERVVFHETEALWRNLWSVCSVNGRVVPGQICSSPHIFFILSGAKLL